MPRRFYDAFREALDSAGWSIPRVCAEANVSKDQVTKFMQRASKGLPASTNVDDAVKLANALGFTLDELLDDRTAQVRSDAVRLWRELTPGERDLLQAAARGRADPAHEPSQ